MTEAEKTALILLLKGAAGAAANDASGGWYLNAYKRLALGVREVIILLETPNVEPEVK